MNVFIPISASNKQFSTARTKEAMLCIPRVYDTYYFVIADRLQFYNNAASMGDAEIAAERWKSSPTQIYDQRIRWLQRLAQQCLPGCKTQFFSMDNLTDSTFMAIFRSILAAYELRDTVREAVDFAVETFLNTRSGVCSLAHIRLSRLYVIEEMALNIHVRTKFRIYDEYYAGDQAEILPRIYGDEMRFMVNNAPFGVGYEADKARFFFWQDTQPRGWTLWGNSSIGRAEESKCSIIRDLH